MSIDLVSFTLHGGIKYHGWCCASCAMMKSMYVCSCYSFLDTFYERSKKGK